MTAPGPMPSILRPLGPLTEAVYRAVINRRNAAFDARKGVVEFDRPTISVGNLSVGGTGKTPVTLLLIRMLRERGRWPCVAMRGYGQRGGMSDEAAEYRAAFPDLPMVVQADRAGGLLEVFASEEGSRVDCILLDDGFQHRRIARHLDIVLVDATRDPFSDHLLPRGWLREPAESLGRAGAVIVTHAEAVGARALGSLLARISTFTRGGVPVVAATHEWSSLTLSPPHPLTPSPVSWLRPRRALACCAVGNPGAFLAQARRHTNVVGEVVLRDHDPYAPATVERVRAAITSANADTLLVTRKDWTKLSRERWACVVAVPDLEVRVDDGAIVRLLDALMPRASVPSSYAYPPAHEPPGA
jgi:tetraacyldisaccharide 4'-kinase